jgi:hypothetical protein
MVSQDANDFLFGGGARSAKFEKHGDTISGWVTAAEPRQQTDFKTKAPLTWPDGNPRMQLVVTLFTELREGDDDDGMRSLYVRGQMQQAVADAIRKAGQRGLAVDGRLVVRYVGDAEPKVRGESGAKQYAARYEAPQVQVTDHDAPPSDLEF